MFLPRHVLVLFFVTLIALLAQPKRAYACASFDFYYTEVTESDAPECLAVSGHQREEESPVITVENRCGESAMISWLPVGASTSTERTIAVDATEDITFSARETELAAEVTIELSWHVGSDTGRLNVRAWNEPELCPDTGLDCSVHAPSTSPPATSSFVGLLIAGFLAVRRRSRTTLR